MASNSIPPKSGIHHLELIHYGAKSFDPNKFSPVIDTHHIKPAGGLWTSPVGSDWGWSDWSKSEEYGDLSSHFCVEYSGNTFVVDSAADAKDLPWIDSFRMGAISFETLAACGYDAVWITKRGERETRYSDEHSLYGWDCETVLIFNSDCISPIECAA